MSEENQAGGFTAPPSAKLGNAEMPKSAGVITKNAATKQASKSVKSTARNIKVVSIAKGWFDCKRVEMGKKFTVSEEEFSKAWMEKI